MPTNTFFNHNNPRNPDQGIYEDLIIESIQIYGVDVYYLPRDIIEEDDILNETIHSKFASAFPIEVYPKDIEGFGGEDLLSKFGLQIKDEVTLIMARRRFDQLITQFTEQPCPQEGDLVYIPSSNTLFEIRFVEDEVPFFQLNNLPVFELQCELFTYEGQSIDTTLDEIDIIEDENINLTHFEVGSITGDFSPNERLNLVTPSGTPINAEFVKYDYVDYSTIFSVSTVTFPDGEVITFPVGTTVTGQDSGASTTIIRSVGIGDEDFPLVDTDGFADNDEYERVVDDFVEFSEDNPFGDL